MHRLALALHKTVGEIESTMAERELRDWQRFEALHQPLPDRLADIHSAMLCSIVVNLVRSADAAPASAADYFVIREREPAPAGDGLSEVDRQRLNWRGG